jgi:exopolysaccharide biosynthesis polyprenyl glycosylphosphotransferase
MEFSKRAAQKVMASDSTTRPTRIHLRPSEQRAILFTGDVIVTILSFLLALYYWSYLDAQLEFTFQSVLERLPGWFYLLPFGWLILMVDLYDVHRAANLRDTIRGIAVAAIAGLIVYAVIYLLSAPGSLPRQILGAFLLLAATLTFLWRLIYIRLYTDPAFMRKVLIIGAGTAGTTLAAAYRRLWPPPFYLVGFIDDDSSKIGSSVEGFPILADSGKLLEIIEEQGVSDFIVAINGEIQGETFQKILDAQENGIEIMRMQTVYEELLGRVPIQHLESDWIIRSFVDETRMHGLYEVGKRILDIIGALVGVLILAFFFPVVAIVTLLDTGFPIIYKQVRLGKGAKPYTIIKFRTMRKDAESDGLARPAAKNDPRITRVGNILRKSRIDELPQFLNVLRGEMSIIGPRSERPELVDHYQSQIPFYRARLLVKPGISGWAQINFGYASTVEDTIIKLEYDLYYIKHRSLLTDISIILRTIGTALGFRGR